MRATRRQAGVVSKVVPRHSRAVSLPRYCAGAVGGLGWAWAVGLLATRHHLPGTYAVIGMAPPGWGLLGLPAFSLLVICGIGSLLAMGAIHEARSAGPVGGGSLRWLAWTWLVPALDLLRLAGATVPMTFLEPLLVAGVTGGAAGSLADRFAGENLAQRLERVPWLAVAWLLAIAAAGWWYFDAVRAYDAFLLGYNDFAHFGVRVANTWNGRGFLLETPSLPAFWDHFNPGLVLLAPLWGAWSDPKLFLLVQAVCLALPAPAVFGIARQLSARDRPGAGLTGLAWAGAYLVYPIVGQFNLSYSYGWHPVTLALPLVFFAILALLRGWRLAALAAAVLACSFQEDIVAILACLAFAMGWAAWLGRRPGMAAPALASPGLSRSLAPSTWLIVGTVLALAFLLIFKLAPYARYQVGRFSELGGSTWEVLFSPVLRPAAFWGTLLRPRCGYLLLGLAVPLGLRPLGRAWPVLLATVIPLGVLLAWNHFPATSLAFHYTTGLIPLLFLAAITGSAVGGVGAAAPGGSLAAAGGQSLRRAGIAALAAGATASGAFGALPWSSPTLTDVVALTYSGDEGRFLTDHTSGGPANRLLHQAVARVRNDHSSVLATGRIAAHLIGAPRIDTVGQAVIRWKDFAEEVGPQRSPIELFDWILIDSAERFYQSPKEIEFILKEARRAGYQVVQSEQGILVLKKPAER